jgi:two-component system sensor histidine kinase/response regulator
MESGSVLEERFAPTTTEAAMARLVALVESSGDAIIGLTLSGTITSWNRGATALYGYCADEMLNRPIDILLAHDRRHEARHLFLPVTRGESDERVDSVHTSKDGQPHDVSLTISAVRESDGRLIGMSVIARDVSAEKRAEEHLRRLSRYFELSRDMVCTAGLDGYFKQLNGTWTETLGWSQAELRSRPMLDFVHPDDHQATLDERDRLPQNGTTIAFVNRYATKDGGWRWIDWNTRFDPEEQLIYATARDITCRKEAEAQAQFQAHLLDAVGEAVITTDLTGCITYWGPGAEKLYGWSARETVGRSIMEVIPAIPAPDPAAVGEIMSRLARGEPYTGIMRLGRRDGSTFLAEITDTPVLDDAGRMVAIIGISSDVSVREEAAEAVKLARDQALEASVLKSHFLANMSHEIRTPMNGVLGMTELLLDTPLDARQREYAETVRSSGDALLAIINDILDLSKIEAGRLELEELPFDLPTVIEDIADLLAGAAHAKGLELVVDIASDIPGLLGDPGRLRQVLANLLGNAVKFTSSGRVVVSSRVTGVTEAGTTVRVEVDDTGIGVKPEVLSRIFEPFAQADSSTNRQYGGTGLGLTITRQLVDLMGGDFGLDSLPGAGSSFWFNVTLPQSGTGAAAATSLHGMKALVVDNDATTRSVLKKYLAGAGIEVNVAGSGPEGLDMARAAVAADAPFGVVLSDMNMPVMNGAELAVALGANPGTEGTPIVLISSSGDIGATRPAGIAASLTKPVRRERLLRTLTELNAVSKPETPVPPAVGATHLHRGRVLLAEDNLINQKVAVAMLESGGYTVDVALNGREAVRALQDHHYEAVLMDCQMPEMDGYEAAAAIRAGEGAGRRIPIIAMTAGAMQEDRDRAKAAGMDDYLAKPVRRKDVLAAVARLAGVPAPAG